MPLSEADMIRRAQRGDREAIAEMYDRYQASIFTYIFYRVSDQECAEDLTGEVFVRMIEKLSSYIQNDRPVLAWLYTIAHNLVIDHYRFNTQNNPMPLEQSLAADSWEDGHPAHQTEEHLAQECLRRVMQLLTEEQRQVIQLKFIEDREIGEVADILGRNERAIRSLQHRALAALQRAMEQERCYEP
ncbi:MAG: sigma-70 family RNA polymerase sigma factor [Omnitrophica WOR_2 bacterium]